MAREEKISFNNCRGDTLSGVLHHPVGNNSDGAVVLCHGMDSDKNSEKLIYLAQQLAEQGILALRFDFSYVGESSGKFEDITYSGEVEDLRAAYALIQKQRPGKTAVFGSSMGGTIALLFAAEETNIVALATLTAPLHPEQFPQRVLSPAQVQQWRSRGFTMYTGRRLNVSLLEDLEQLDVKASVRNIRCPVLILHGDADEVVPVKEARELDACLPSAKRLLIFEGADHRLSDPVLMRRALAETLDWLTRYVRYS